MRNQTTWCANYDPQIKKSYGVDASYKVTAFRG